MTDARYGTGNRLQLLRERAGLSPGAAAEQMGISMPCLNGLEWHDDELFSCYSAQDVMRFCRALKVTPAELLGVEEPGSRLSPGELASMTAAQCQARGQSIEALETEVGWNLSSFLSEPESLLSQMPLDGLMDLCQELGVDWLRLLIPEIHSSSDPSSGEE